MSEDRRYEYLGGIQALDRKVGQFPVDEPGSIWWELPEEQEPDPKTTLTNDSGSAILVTGDELRKYFKRVPLCATHSEMPYPIVKQIADAVIRDTNIVERLKEAVQKGHYDERGCLDNTERTGVEQGNGHRHPSSGGNDHA